MGVVTNVAGRPAERSLSYDVSTTEKRCLFIAITDQLMASSTPRYGTPRTQESMENLSMAFNDS